MSWELVANPPVRNGDSDCGIGALEIVETRLEQSGPGDHAIELRDLPPAQRPKALVVGLQLRQVSFGAAHPRHNRLECCGRCQAGIRRALELRQMDFCAAYPRDNRLECSGRCGADVRRSLELCQVRFGTANPHEHRFQRRCHACAGFRVLFLNGIADDRVQYPA
jgi:hypothetical protein